MNNKKFPILFFTVLLDVVSSVHMGALAEVLGGTQSVNGGARVGDFGTQTVFHVVDLAPLAVDLPGVAHVVLDHQAVAGVRAVAS